MMQYVRTLKLKWNTVSDLIGKIISEILHRPICGNASSEDDYYWDFQATGTKISIGEIEALITHVHGDDRMRMEALPVDSDSSASIGEDLSRALLKHALGMTWYHESTNDEALWLMDVQEQHKGGTCKCP